MSGAAFVRRLALRYVERAATPILFHRTDAKAASNILIQRRFVLTPSEASDVESNLTPGTYFLSTGRAPINAFTRNHSWGVIFVLDGNALSHKYKIKPIDYWKYGPKSSETEDRILSNGPYLPLKYVMEIRVYGLHNEEAVPLLRLAKKEKIPIRFFETLLRAALGKKDYKLDLKGPFKSAKGFTPYGVIALKPYVMLLSLPSDKLRIILSKYSKQIGHLWDEPYSETRDRQISAMKRSDAGRLVSLVQKLKDADSFNMYFSDAQASISVDMRNARSASHRDRENLDQLVSYMRLHKLANTKALLKALIAKAKTL